MAGTTIQITPELLRNEAKNVRRIKSDHDTQMTNLFRIVRSLESNWKGKSQDAYVQNFESMKPVFDKFTKMLEESKFSKEKWPLAFDLLNNCGGENHEGFIGLQDHGDDVWYRNIRVKILD